jgi:hypothetical protein
VPAYLLINYEYPPLGGGAATAIDEENAHACLDSRSLIRKAGRVLYYRRFLAKVDFSSFALLTLAVAPLTMSEASG